MTTFDYIIQSRNGIEDLDLEQCNPIDMKHPRGLDLKEIISYKNPFIHYGWIFTYTPQTPSYHDLGQYPLHTRISAHNYEGLEWYIDPIYTIKCVLKRNYANTVVYPYPTIVKWYTKSSIFIPKWYLRNDLTPTLGAITKHIFWPHGVGTFWSVLLCPTPLKHSLPMHVFKAKAYHAMVIVWEASDWGDHLALVNPRHDRVITTMFCKMNVLVFLMVQCIPTNGCMCHDWH